MADARWKRAERRIARMCGTERIGPTGKDTFDCINEDLNLGVEVKSRKSLPKWLKDAMEQSEDHTIAYHEKENKYLYPIVALVERGMLDSEVLCVMRLESYIRMRTVYMNLITPQK